MVPTCIRPPHSANLSTTLPTVRMIVDVSRSVAILSTAAIIKLLRSKTSKVDAKAWPTILDSDDSPKAKKLPQPPFQLATLDQPCYLDFAVSTTGTLAGITVTHRQAATLCKSLKLTCELYQSRQVCLALDPYAGLGFTLWVLSSVYSGHETLLIPPCDVEANPPLWLQTISQHKIRDTFCSYGVMELCVRELSHKLEQMKTTHNVQLSTLRTCVVVGEERPRNQLVQAFVKLFQPLGLLPRAVSTSFGCRVRHF